MVSQLESVPGIGPAKRKALLRAFGNSINAIRGASVEELAAVPGITPYLAELIKEAL
jgi:excinuclease ABC subunit C